MYKRYKKLQHTTIMLIVLTTNAARSLGTTNVLKDGIKSDNTGYNRL